MRKFSKILILSAVMVLPFSTSASTANVDNVASTCKIKDKNGSSTFKAKGECDEVAAAYEVWKKAQK